MQVILLVPIVPLVPMDERNRAVLKLNRSENRLSPLNEMQFTNGVSMECQVILLVPIVPLVPMDERNPAVHKPNRSENRLSSLNEMQFTNGVPMECQSIPLDSVCVYWTTLINVIIDSALINHYVRCVIQQSQQYQVLYNKNRLFSK